MYLKATVIFFLELTCVNNMWDNEPKHNTDPFEWQTCTIRLSFLSLPKMIGPCIQSTPQVHLVANYPPPPNTKVHFDILFLNKNISLIREYYINVNTWRIVSTTVLTLQAKNLP